MFKQIVKSLALSVTLLFCLPSSADAQLTSPEKAYHQAQEQIKQYHYLSEMEPYRKKWEGEQLREELSKSDDGKISFGEFYANGTRKIKYQKGPDGNVDLFHYYSNGKLAYQIQRDSRILDYKAYWPNGEEKAKLQHNAHSNELDYHAMSSDGKVVYSGEVEMVAR